MDMLVSQQMPMKPMEPDVLEPLKLEHFYLTLFGNTAGILLALLAFVTEKLVAMCAVSAASENNNVAISTGHLN